MVEANYQSKDVGQILKPRIIEYQSGHGYKSPTKSCSICSVEETREMNNERVQKEIKNLAYR